MKKILLVGLCFVFMLSIGIMAFAAGPGAGQSGASISLGYEGAYLSYKEANSLDGTTLDKDTGWLNGGSAEARYDAAIAGVPFFVRGTLDFLGSDHARYTGSLQDGTPLRMSTKESIAKTEFDLGIKVWNDRGGTLAFYGGLGYRWWDRGADNLPDYMEKYTWGFGAVGANVAWRITDRFVLALDTAALIPISPKMKTDIAGLVDVSTFKIKSRPGYRVQLPATYDIYVKKGFAVQLPIMKDGIWGSPRRLHSRQEDIQTHLLLSPRAIQIFLGQRRD
jgi:hypothetical protein